MIECMQILSLDDISELDRWEVEHDLDIEMVINVFFFFLTDV